MRRFHAWRLLLILGILSAMIVYAQESDPACPPPADTKQPPKTDEEKKDKPTTYQCAYWVKGENDMGDLFDRPVEGDLFDDCEEAKADAGEEADLFIMENNITPDPGYPDFHTCTPSCEEDAALRTTVDLVNTSARRRCQVTCLMDNGRQAEVIRDANSPDMVSETVRECFRILNENVEEAGRTIVFGTSRVRVQEPYSYYCYLRVRCEDEDGQIARDFEVEAHGQTHALAEDGAQESKSHLEETCRDNGEMPQVIEHNRPRFVRVSFVDADYHEPNAFAVYRCDTADGWTVFAGRYGRNITAAMAAAQEAARRLADDFGGAEHGTCRRVRIP